MPPTPPVDSVLLVGFGGPEGPADVLPFLRTVTSGRDVPEERLREVAGHYLEAFGGVSPINAQVNALAGALQEALSAAGAALPVYWGNRNWHPFLAETVGRMGADGRRHGLYLPMSPYPSYSSCRQYDDDVDAARETAGEGAPLLSRVRHYDTEDGFLASQAAEVRTALAGLSEEARLVFTAHSLPVAAAESSGPTGGGYVAALRRAAAGVVARLPETRQWDLVFQSRSGPPSVPWLGPDVGDHLAALYAAGTREVVLVPVGFLSDHVEVCFDLDIEAAARAAALPGLVLRRAGTVGTADRFVAALRDLLLERAGGQVPAGRLCPADCCPPPVSRRPPPPPPRG